MLPAFFAAADLFLHSQRQPLHDPRRSAYRDAMAPKPTLVLLPGPFSSPPGRHTTNLKPKPVRLVQIHAMPTGWVSPIFRERRRFPWTYKASSSISSHRAAFSSLRSSSPTLRTPALQANKKVYSRSMRTGNEAPQLRSARWRLHTHVVQRGPFSGSAREFACRLGTVDLIRSSITELSFHGIPTSRPLAGGKV